MDKHEVLERSRNDNTPVDERFKFTEMRIGYFMTSVMLVVWAILFAWDTWHDVDRSVGLTIMLSGIATMCFCQFRQTHAKGSLALCVLAALGAGAFAVYHIMTTML